VGYARAATFHGKSGDPFLCTVILSLAEFTSAQTVTPVVTNGPSSNRLDIVILGDGYTAADLPKYYSDVQQFLSLMLQQQPYREYTPLINVYRVDVTSAESGVDHPEAGIYKNTVLDAAYNCNGTQRLICVDTTKVFNIVNSVMLPSQRDAIIVVVNDSTYGGAGYASGIAVTSTNSSSVEIVLHELGHSLGLLADEYDSSPPPCDVSVEPAQVNITKATTLATIKWKAWIDPGTPLPTLSNAAGCTRVV